MGLGQSQVTPQISPLQEQSHASGDLLRLGGGHSAVQLEHLIPHQNPPSSYHPPQADASSAFFLGQEFQEPQPHHSFLQSKPFHGLVQLPDLHNGATGSSSPAATTAATGLFNLGAFSNNRTASNLNSINSHLLMPDQFSNSVGSGTKPAALFVGNMVGDQMSSGGVPSLYNSSVQKEQVLPQMSATALLQKAAQMGATTSSSGSTMLRAYGNPPSRNSSKGGDFRVGYGDGNGGQSMRIQMENETHLQDLMNSLAHGGVGVFGGGPGGGGAFGGSCTGGGHEHEAVFGGFYPNLCNMDAASKLRNSMSMGGSMGGSDRLTRDFLGVGSMVRSMGSEVSQRDPHHPVDISSEMKSPPASRSFSGGNLQ